MLQSLKLTCVQVMARKMVNPDISLFHPVPEGALTYQPNPNSIVQVHLCLCWLLMCGELTS